MFVFYGLEARVLHTESVADTCAICHSPARLVAVLGRYVHVYWIPTMPIPRTGRLVCEGCGHVDELKQLAPPERAAYEQALARTRSPWWYWTGTALLLLLLAFVLWGPDGE